MPSKMHSGSFLAVRDAILELQDADRTRVPRLFGPMTLRPHRKLGELRRILREIAALDDDDLEKPAKWFSTWVSDFGQMPRATGFELTPAERLSPPAPPKIEGRARRDPG